MSGFRYSETLGVAMYLQYVQRTFIIDWTHKVQ